VKSEVWLTQLLMTPKLPTLQLPLYHMPISRHLAG